LFFGENIQWNAGCWDRSDGYRRWGSYSGRQRAGQRRTSEQSPEIERRFRRILEHRPRSSGNYTLKQKRIKNFRLNPGEFFKNKRKLGKNNKNTLLESAKNGFRFQVIL